MNKCEWPLTIGIALVTIISGAVMSTAQTSDKTSICAEREITLQMLLESDGTEPNASSIILNDNAAWLRQARAACDNGRFADAIVYYDRVVGEMTVKK